MHHETPTYDPAQAPSTTTAQRRSAVRIELAELAFLAAFLGGLIWFAGTLL